MSRSESAPQASPGGWKRAVSVGSQVSALATGGDRGVRCLVHAT